MALHSVGVVGVLSVGWASQICPHFRGLNPVGPFALRSFLLSSPHYSNLYRAKHPSQSVCTPHHGRLVFPLLCLVLVQARTFLALCPQAYGLKWTPLRYTHIWCLSWDCTTLGIGNEQIRRRDCRSYRQWLSSWSWHRVVQSLYWGFHNWNKWSHCSTNPRIDQVSWNLKGQGHGWYYTRC